MTFAKDDRILCNNQPGTVLHYIPARYSGDCLYVLRLDNGRAAEARPQELRPYSTPGPALEPISREDLHAQLCRVYSKLMGRMVDDRMWDMLAIIEAHLPLGPPSTQVCGAVEPNQSPGNAALCDRPVGHEELWHEGFAHGLLAKDRPGRFRWAIVTPTNLDDLIRETTTGYAGESEGYWQSRGGGEYG